jgi:hypothetical protein
MDFLHPISGNTLGQILVIFNFLVLPLILMKSEEVRGPEYFGSLVPGEEAGEGGPHLKMLDRRELERVGEGGHSAHQFEFLVPSSHIFAQLHNPQAAVEVELHLVQGGLIQIGLHLQPLQ